MLPRCMHACLRQARLWLKTGAEVGSALWDDNFVVLLPGEERVLTATYSGSDPAAGASVDIWNNIVPAR